MDGHELHRTERERDLLAQLVDTTLQAIVSVDTDGTIDSWNKGAVELFGYEAAEAIGQPASLIAPTDRKHEAGEIIGRVLKGESIPPFDTVRQRKDGKTLDVSVTAGPLKDPNGVPIGCAAVYHDLTDRRRLEAQLLQSQKMEALGGLAGGIAHDFNNLLAVIMSYGRFVIDDVGEDSPVRPDVQQIVNAAERGSSLVRQLLAFSRQEVVRPEVIDVNRLVTEIQPLLDRVVRENMRLDTSLAPGLWATEADHGQLEQVLLNLVVNARDAISEGGVITISTKNIEVDDTYSAAVPGFTPGRYACLVVGDTGSGMDKETQDRIFEPFFTTKARGSGTGLGLSTVYGIVKRSGGFVTVYSEIGLGTTFRVYLPATDNMSEELAAAPPTVTTGRGERILVVEDEQSVLDVIIRILSSADYEPVGLTSADEALHLLSQPDHGFRLLLTDVIMPSMSGRTLSESTEVRTIFMSGYTDSIIEEQGILQEGVAFLPKPFNASELLAVVRESLDDLIQAELGVRALSSAPIKKAG